MIVTSTVTGLLMLTGCSVDGPVQGKPVRLVVDRMPDTPTGLAIVAEGSDGAKVTWDAPAGGSPLVTSYQLDLDDEQQVKLPGNITSHTFVGVGSGEWHTATLTAVGTAHPSLSVTASVDLPPDASGARRESLSPWWAGR